METKLSYLIHSNNHAQENLRVAFKTGIITQEQFLIQLDELYEKSKKELAELLSSEEKELGCE